LKKADMRERKSGFLLLQKGGEFMGKCKNRAVDLLTPAKTQVSVTVNVTNIVKYVSLAGVAIVGIIFGTKSYIECVKVQKGGSEKN